MASPIVQKIKSFEELHSALARYRRDNTWLFRGQARIDWDLLPKAGRPPFSGRDDQPYFEAWKRRAAEYISPLPNSDWDWLAIAQHHGLATRLLDWSYYPLVAAYFAVCEEHDADAVVYCYRYQWIADRTKVEPFKIKDIAVFKPSGIVSRITRQGGVFTVHKDPAIPAKISLGPKELLETVIIDKNYRKELLFELNHYGINRSTLFPDLDGLSAHTNWCVKNRDYWNPDNWPYDLYVG